MLLLLLIYNTQLHNSLGLLVLSQASLRKSRASTSTRNNGSPDVHTTPGKNPPDVPEKPLLKHSSRLSRPFDVLYKNPPSQKSLGSRHLDLDFEKYKTASYIRIEEAIRSGKTMTDSSDSPLSAPPVVTLVDTPRRSQSVISNSPTLRRRNTFKNRNRIQRRRSPLKDDLPSLVFSGESKNKARKRTSKLSFVFPIKRRTSYKYFPVSRAHPKESRFTSQNDIDSYFIKDNILALMKDVIPRTMAVFEYKNITHISPELVSHPRKFAISRDAKFTMLSGLLEEKAPLQGAKINEERSPTNVHLDTASENSLLAKRRTFLSAVHAKYRAVVLAEGGKIPQKVEEAFPFEGEMMTDEEKERMNTQILLEILLRRTVAAKIDFRLKRSGVSPEKRPSKHSKSSSNSSNSSSFGRSSRRNRHVHDNKFTPRQFELSHRNTSSINTDELMQHNASLLSELLPSPQISFTSNILGMDVSPTNTHDIPFELLSEHKVKVDVPFTIDRKKLEGWDFQDHGLLYDPRKDTFIYDISKLNLARKKPRPISAHLGNVNDTSLRPLAGSNHTISSYSIHSVENLAHYDTSSSAYQQKRSSNSTGETTRSTENTSLFNTLDFNKTAHTNLSQSDLKQVIRAS